MRKIPSVWRRDHSVPGALYTDEVTAGCEWVIDGDGFATRKWDGTACRLHDGVLYARFDAKHGKTPPLGFEPCQEPDPVSGHWPGWVPATRPQDVWIREAYENSRLAPTLKADTYEAIGPKIGGNPERVDRHELRRHGDVILAHCPRTFRELRQALASMDIEGIVFHHPDGRMAKATKQGFGLPRTPVLRRVSR